MAALHPKYGDIMRQRGEPVVPETIDFECLPSVILCAIQLSAPGCEDKEIVQDLAFTLLEPVPARDP